MQQAQTTSFECDELLSRCMGHPDFARRLVSKFEQRLTTDLEELQNKIRAGDAEGIANVAHRIKGAASNIAAHQIGSQAAAIEQLARDSALDLLDQSIELIQLARADFSESVAASPLGG